MQVAIFIVGLTVVILTIFSALSTFVLPRAARSRLNRIVFSLLRYVFEFLLKLARDYPRRDAIMAYYSPIGLILLVPVWYLLIMLGYTAMFWAVTGQGVFDSLKLSGSSLFTLGFASTQNLAANLMVYSEALLGLLMVALLMAYLPTMYAAFSRREQLVNLLEVRAGSPPNAFDMLSRFNRIHGLEKLGDYWKLWEAWFADVEESHTTLPALVFFRSPRADKSWITSAGAVLDTAALTLSSIDIPYETSAALCLRAGFLALRSVADYFEIAHPRDPHFPETPISIARAEYDDIMNRLVAIGIPVKQDREQAWKDFAGWRVNYDRVLLALCTLVMAPQAPWSSDRAPKFRHPPLIVIRRRAKAK